MTDAQLEKLATRLTFMELANNIKAVARSELARTGHKYDPKKIEAWAIHRAAVIRDRARGKQ